MTMSLEYVIDGYNVINHPAFSRYSSKKIHDKRKALVNLIKTSRLTGSLNNKIIVVFDGYPSSQGDDCLKTDSEPVCVIFSRDESADDKIKRIVESCPNPKIVIVVSDDKQIQLIVKALNAGVMGVEEFICGKEKLKKNYADDEPKAKLNYSQMHQINAELEKLWLKSSDRF